MHKTRDRKSLLDMWILYLKTEDNYNDADEMRAMHLANQWDT